MDQSGPGTQQVPTPNRRGHGHRNPRHAYEVIHWSCPPQLKHIQSLIELNQTSSKRMMVITSEMPHLRSMKCQRGTQKASMSHELLRGCMHTFGTALVSLSDFGIACVNPTAWQDQLDVQ